MALIKIAFIALFVVIACSVVNAGPSGGEVIRSKDGLVKDDGCGDGYCQCNGGCHTCQSCKRFDMMKDLLEPELKDDGCGDGYCQCCKRLDLAINLLKPELKDDGCGDGYCQCNGGCHTCQSCKRFDMMKDLLEPELKDDGCGDGYCQCN